MSDQKVPPTSPREPLLSREEMQQIMEATAAARLLDRFGRPILPGCEIELHSELPPVFTVLDARPAMHPGAPQGMWTLTIGTQLAVVCQQGKRHAKMTVVGFAEVPAEQPTTGDPATSAASDAPAAPSSSIILTDMDKAARETLAESPLKLVPTIDHGGED